MVNHHEKPPFGELIIIFLTFSRHGQQIQEGFRDFEDHVLHP